MDKRLYFHIDNSVACDILNTQRDTDKFSIKIKVFEYQGDTNHPSDLGKKYYFEYLHTIEVFRESVKIIRNTSFAFRETIMTTPDYRTMPKTEEEAIELVKCRLGVDN